MNQQTEMRYPVALLLSRNWKFAGQWRYPHWEIVSILPAANTAVNTDDIPQMQYRHVHTAESGDHYLWSGLWLEFFRDAMQAYYQNMTGARPSLFVLCNEQDETPGLAPISISASHGDAEAHMESDGIVLVTPLTAPFSGWLADFLLQRQSLFENQLAQLHKDKKGKHRHV